MTRVAVIVHCVLCVKKTSDSDIQASCLSQSIVYICGFFIFRCRATLYPCPDNVEERREMIIGVSSRIDDLNMVMNQTLDHRRRVLTSTSRKIKEWFVKVRKTKAIYHMLNYFNLDVTQKALIGECWCPVKDLDRIKASLKRGTERSGSTMPAILNRMATKQNPPTFNRTNKFTRGFQAIVDSYGAATYGEVNPAPWTIITFPFLFAVMFGDAGHGLIMALAAAYLIWKEIKIKALNSRNEIFTTFFDGRYIVLLMGIFSMYTGFMYNDVFAKSLNLFGSKWKAVANDTGSATFFVLDPERDYSTHGPYEFGIDPVSKKIYFDNLK